MIIAMMTILLANERVSPELNAAAKRQIGRVIAGQNLADTDGKSVQIGGKKARPTLLYFIQDGCPCCKAAKPFVDRFQTYYGDVADVVGIINVPTKSARTWQTDVTAQYRVVPDPKMRLIRSFGVTNGTSMILLDQKGRVMDSYAGYSLASLKKLTAQITKIAAISARPYIYAPAPKVEMTGCPFVN